MPQSEYLSRMIEKELLGCLNVFGAVLIIGPKWCGKTTTAKRYAKSILDLQDEDKLKDYMAIADQKISLLLKGANPRLIDEWQTIPRLWDAVRYEADIRNETGLFILTGSTTVDNLSIKHSGAGRISRIKMGKCERVSMESLEKVFSALKCDIADIMKILPADAES